MPIQKESYTSRIYLATFKHHISDVQMAESKFLSNFELGSMVEMQNVVSCNELGQMKLTTAELSLLTSLKIRMGMIIKRQAVAQLESFHL